MKTKLLINILFLVVIGFAGCGQSPKAVNNPNQATAKVKKSIYRCPMDSDVTSDKPGNCPKCGMEMEKVD